MEYVVKKDGKYICNATNCGDCPFFPVFNAERCWPGWECINKTARAWADDKERIEFLQKLLHKVRDFIYEGEGAAPLPVLMREYASNFTIDGREAEFAGNMLVGFAQSLEAIAKEIDKALKATKE